MTARTPDQNPAQDARGLPLSAERGESGADHASRVSRTAASGDARVVLVLEYALDPDADPDAVERVVHDYVRRLQDVPLHAPMTPPVIHAAIDDFARRVLAVFDR